MSQPSFCPDCGRTLAPSGFCARCALTTLTVTSRSPAATAAQIDLGGFYNADLKQSWQNRRDEGNNLTALPFGLTTLGDVQFDFRGIIQLTSNEIAEFKLCYPERVDGIQIKQNATKLHFLHGAGWHDRDDVEIARYLVHYGDGATDEVPVRYEETVRNWQMRPQGVAQEHGGTQRAWNGPQGCWKNHWPHWGVRLYHTTWTNPHPKKMIESVDFISTMTQTAPFLIAITCE